MTSQSGRARSTNDLALAIAQELGAASASDNELPFFDWSQRLPVPNIGPLDFGCFPFQREWYEDDEVVYAREVVLMKATQCGASEYFVRWSLFFPDRYGECALYVFPTERTLSDFSDERIKPLLQDPYLRKRISRDSIDNKTLKDVGEYGKWYARGSQKASGLDSVPASVLCLDEYDDLVQEHIPRAEKRLSSPLSRGLIRRFGVPRYSDLGVHAEYEKSDQRRWHVTCGKCGAELPIHFYKQDQELQHYVDQEQAAIICGECETKIKRDWIISGRWIAKYPEREIVGYHVSRLILPTASIKDIVAESKRTKPFEIQEFWNSTLGLPYDPAEGRLARQAIAGATRDYYIGEWDSGYAGPHLVTAGVDVASSRNLNVRISEHLDQYSKRALFIGEVLSFEQLEVMVEAYKVNCMLIDHAPDGREAKRLVNRFPGRVFTVSWSDTRGDVLKVDNDMGEVSARRSNAIGVTLDMIRQQKNELPENVPDDYVAHMRAAVQKREEDEKGRVKVYFETAASHDYLQAESYDVLATETWWWNYNLVQAQQVEMEQLDDVVPFERSRLGEIGYIGTVLPQPQQQPPMPEQAEQAEQDEQDEQDDEFQEPWWWPF